MIFSKGWGCRIPIAVAICTSAAAQAPRIMALESAFTHQYTVSTVAGQGVAVALKYPTSVAVDSAGDLYGADWSGYIRKVRVNEKTTTIVAGSGILGYSVMVARRPRP